ncbi:MULTISPECIES: N-acetylneuraminate synthase family protein [Thalassospira]|uniref:N-acetylneuraminate synthase family protein n=1 Tax=Thalassospira TaxID=168934 RepID=UPI0007A3A2B7|nr:MULTISPECIES: N-acetylneuraminate synthase family protein [Thalassospira]KZB70931.1 hypothetical protein AUQ43_08770 [Thalassospira sp. MCCC 1A01148]MBR9899350.1 N-acylneuraminate-9-phosphate synthase [Rhodospirillales bacterium]
MFRKSFRIGERQVGEDNPCLFIAEAGVAHFGDMSLARDLVDLAAESKADVFKTQIFDVDELISNDAADWKDRLRPRNLTLDQALELKERAESRGMSFMATAHDTSRLSWIAELDLPAIKVGSGEKGNPWFLRKLAEFGKPMIVSTGMYSNEEVLQLVKLMAQADVDQLALLHCVTSYPTPADDVNLAAMESMKDIFAGPVGYSDHTVDGLAVLGAVARGAKVIEKHITILRDVPNAQDWRVSAGPEDLAQLVSDVRRMEKMIGLREKKPASCEVAGMDWALKSVVVARDLSAGHVLSDGDLTAKRPGNGIPAAKLESLIGRTLRREVQADTQLADDMLTESINS